MNMGMKFKKKGIEIDGRGFFYWCKGYQQKETIILLHGFPGNHAGLIDLANALGNKRQIIIPDLPACGLSEELRGKHVLKNYAKWLNDFLERLSIQEAIIIGHSFGSRVAMFFSIDYPQKVKKLILITPVVEVNGFITRIATLYYRVGGILPRYFQKIWLSNELFKRVGDTILFKSSNPVMHKKIIDRDVKELKKVNQQVIIDLFNEFYKFQLISLGKRIDAKTLIIAGDKDEIATLVSLKTLAHNVQKASLKVMKDSGHLVPLEKPLATAKIIKNWLP